MTECSGEQLEFQSLGKRVVVGRFDGGAISSDGGAVLLRDVERRTRGGRWGQVLALALAKVKT